jgi:hypothetical protein
MIEILSLEPNPELLGRAASEPGPGFTTLGPRSLQRISILILLKKKI